jgi:hypothetical protein
MKRESGNKQKQILARRQRRRNFEMPQVLTDDRIKRIAKLASVGMAAYAAENVPNHFGGDMQPVMQEMSEEGLVMLLTALAEGATEIHDALSGHLDELFEDDPVERGILEYGQRIIQRLKK